MSNFDKAVNLLSQTDGRDKIYKSLGGLFKILSFIEEGHPRAAAYKALGSSITDGRSLMRMAKWSGDVNKMNKIFALYMEKGSLETKKIIEFLRTLGNAVYILGDNITFLAKRKLVPVNSKAVQHFSKVAQFWGFFLAVVLDIMALKVSLLKNSENYEALKKELKATLISLTKNVADVLVTMPAVGYLKEIWSPNAATTGALTVVSGGIATYLNWKKTK